MVDGVWVGVLGEVSGVKCHWCYSVDLVQGFLGERERERAWREREGKGEEMVGIVGIEREGGDERRGRKKGKLVG